MTDNNRANIFFQSTPCLPSHVHALRADADGYTKDLKFLCESGTFAVVSSGVRARILAALHITAQHDAVVSLLGHCEVTDIVKAATLLDRPRRSRQLGIKIQRIEKDHPELIVGDDVDNMDDGDDSNDKDNKDMEDDNNKDETPKRKKRVRKLDIYRRENKMIRAELEELQEADHDESCGPAHDKAVKDLIQTSSASGAFARKVRSWARKNLKSDFLEFALLALPADPWRSLADLVHFAPADFCVPYFLSEVHKDTRKKKKSTNDDAKDASGNSSQEGEPTAMAEETFVANMRDLVQISDGDELEKKFFELVKEFPQTYLLYSFLRKHRSVMSRSRIVEDLARQVPLDTSVWWFEELFEASPACGSIIHDRLKGSDDINRSTVKSKATYGKLVERILTIGRIRPKFESDVEQMVSNLGFSRLQAMAALRRHNGNVESAAEWVFEDPNAVDAAVEEERRREQQEGTKDEEERAARENVTRGIANEIKNFADSRLNDLKAFWEKGVDAKVAVFGDASESMQAAIEAATIFAGMVSVCFDGELSFFSYKSIASPHEKPSNVHETLEVCNAIRASGCTAPAAALWPYYEQKKSMDMFVLVTDEYENEPFKDHRFADLLAKYKCEVNENVTLVLVCVGKGSQEFRESLAKNNIDYRVVYIDESRPDLAKFDALIGQLSMVSSRRKVETEEMDEKMAEAKEVEQVVGEEKAQEHMAEKGDEGDLNTGESKKDDEFVIV